MPLHACSIAALTAAAAVVGTAAPALADTGYSVATETSGGNGFTGVSVTRGELAPTHQNCDGAHPLYQSEWVADPASEFSGPFVELGTARFCGGSTNPSQSHWYWGHGFSGTGVFTYLGTEAIGSGSHTFLMDRDTSGNYYYKIAGSVVAEYHWNLSFDYVQAGLESHDFYASDGFTPTVEQSLFYAGLQDERNASGTFVDWSGRDANTVAPNIGGTGPMEGGWWSDTAWLPCENVTC